MNQNYAHLPPHIIVNILQILPLKDLKNAVLICKHWYNASCCSAIGSRLKIHFNGSSNSSFKRLTVNRPINRLELTKVNLSQWKYNAFFKNLNSLRELRLAWCYITLNKLVKCLKYSPDLESLLIVTHSKTNFEITKQSYKNLVNPLVNIKRLCIYCFADQCEGINFILSKCINLKELSYDARYHSSKFISLFNAMAQWPCIDLNSLEIINSVPNDVTTFFKCFCGLNKVTVKKLKLRLSSEYDRDEFKNFCKKLHGLEDLEMGTVDDLDLENICEYMTNLRFLCIREFTGRQLRVIGRLNHLELLNVMRIKDERLDAIHNTGSVIIGRPYNGVVLATRDEIRQTIFSL